MTELKQTLDSLLDQYQFPGVTLAYALPDRSVGEIACGFADVETRALMTTQSRMLVASVGKTFVAATILALAMEGQLKLDDSLSCLLSGYSWYCRLPNHDTITIRHLLQHSSGLANHIYTPGFLQSITCKEYIFSPESLIEYIFDQTALFKSGEGWAYSDTGYILLGLVIEAITGKSYYEELSRRFLKPLNLNMTDPSDRCELPGLVAGYAAQDNVFGLPSKTIDQSGRLIWNPMIEWTGGGLISTSHDLALWAKYLYEGYVMPSDYLTDLLQSIPIDDKGSGVRYGMGVLIRQNTVLGEKWGHFGAIPGYCTSMSYYPKHRIAIAFQINTDMSSADIFEAIELRLAKLVLQFCFGELIEN